MAQTLSDRLNLVVEALPLREGMRVLEIGCGPGAAAREVVRRIGDGHVHAIDRSARAIAQAVAQSRGEIETGRLSFEQIAVEDFRLAAGEPRYDLAFAVRVGALDGRHPEVGQRALLRLADALTPHGMLLVGDGPSMMPVPWL